MMKKEKKTDDRQKIGRLSLKGAVFLILFPLVTAVLALGIGRMSITPAETVKTLWLGLTGQIEKSTTVTVTILKIRLPRVLLALLTGAGLSAAGCAFQSLFANPLATPDTVGVASGSAFGAALGILTGAGLAGIQLISFVFGLAAAALTFFAGSGKDRSMNSVVLAGIMIGSLFSALLSLVKFMADSETQLPAITFFLMGSLENAGYRKLLYGAVPVLLGILTLSLLKWRMNLLPMTEDEVRSFGVNMRALRLVTVLSATLMTASCVSMCGQVGWIGLLVPHMCRMVYKNNHLSLIPASISVGAGFMVIVDTLARSLSSAEIPVSVLTAIIGAPFFIYLMKKNGGWKL